MIVPVSITVKNFLSIENLTFDFDEGVTLPVFGVNKTDPGKESNGSGKSSFQQAIEFALKRTTSRYDRDTLLIQRGKDEAFICIILFNRKTDELIQVEHTIRKKGSSCKILLNGISVEVSGVDEARKWLLEYIDISVEDISSFYLPNERNYVPFFMGSNTKKVALITRLSNSGLVDLAIEKVNRDIELNEDLSRKCTNKILSTEAQIEVYRGEILKVNSEDFEKQKQLVINSYNIKIDEIELHNSELKKRIEGINVGISENQVELENLNGLIDEVSKKFDDIPSTELLSEEISHQENTKKEFLKVKGGIQNQYREEEAATRKLFQDKSNYENILSGEITCPKCSHKFLLRKDVSLDEIKSNLGGVLKTIEEKNSVLKNFTSLIEEIDSDVKNVDVVIKKKSEEVSSVNILRVNLNNQLSKLKTLIQGIVSNNETNTIKIKGYISQIEHNLSEINSLKKRIESKKNELFDDSKIDEYNKLIALKQEEISVETKRYQDYGQKLMNLKAWVVNFKKFKSFLANKQLKVIQGLANTQLKAMGTDIQIKIEGFKTLASGEIREQITGYIIENGDIAEYKEFSKGERARIDYAMILAMQNLCNSSSKNGGIDLLFADEISEGIDPLGNELLLNAISKTGRTSLVVSHVGTNTPDGVCVMAIKINGSTEILKGLKHELERKFQQL